MPAETTLPMITSSIESDEIPERRTTSFMTIAPSCGAVKLARLPRNLPVGMRTAQAITGVCSDIASSPLDLWMHCPLIHNIVNVRKQPDIPISLYRVPGRKGKLATGVDGKSGCSSPSSFMWRRRTSLAPARKGCHSISHLVCHPERRISAQREILRFAQDDNALPG